MFQNLSSNLKNMRNNSITAFFYMTTGIAVGSTLLYYGYQYTSEYRTKHMKDMRDKNELKISKLEEEPYENKYYDKFQEMDSSQELEEDYVKSLKNNVLYEMTPKGRIIMYYDFEKESFIYYCDTKDVPYLYLETVARKYAITYHCKKIVVDIKKELELAREASLANNTNSKLLVGVKASDSLFASFKSYNRKGTGGSKSVNKKFVLRQNANRYSYGGKVGKFPMLKTEEYKVEHHLEKMDYETFKKLTAKKN